MTKQAPVIIEAPFYSRHVYDTAPALHTTTQKGRCKPNKRIWSPRIPKVHTLIYYFFFFTFLVAIFIESVTNGIWMVLGKKKDISTNGCVCADSTHLARIFKGYTTRWMFKTVIFVPFTFGLYFYCRIPSHTWKGYELCCGMNSESGTRHHMTRAKEIHILRHLLVWFADGKIRNIFPS